jgi:hypothetical protein
LAERRHHRPALPAFAERHASAIDKRKPADNNLIQSIHIVMTPDQIRACLAQALPDLVSEPRSSPDGWSFSLGEAKGGPHANRIIRATRSSPDAKTQLKLAITSRLTEELEIDFTGDEKVLRKLVERELRLYHDHFCNRLHSVGPN